MATKVVNFTNRYFERRKSMLNDLIRMFKLYRPDDDKEVTEYVEKYGERVVGKTADGRGFVYDNYDHTIWDLPKDEDLTKEVYSREFGRSLERALQLSGMTQYELADKTGISKNQISKYVRGKAMPTFYSVELMAKALGVTPNDLRYF